MRYLPLFLDVRGLPVLLVGGGVVAERKLQLLREAGARITVVAPQVTAAIAALAASADSSVRHHAELFRAQHLHDQRLVIAATSDASVNANVAATAQALGIWANVVDDATRSSCIVPAIVDRSPLMIAISSGGTAPMLARWVRAKIETLLDPSIGALAGLLESWRKRIVAAIATPNARRELYDDLLEGEFADLTRAGRRIDAEHMLAQRLAGTKATTAAQARVALVGAGPGDPGLLTLNALRALQRADVILHDRLVSPGVLALSRRDALLVSVGKTAGGTSTSQADIHALLVQYSQSHRYVVRLKGGDPFLFGRGGEELETLQRAGIAFEVIPGITAAVAAGAYAGIPLTHRDYAQGLRLLTAHAGEGRNAPDWRGWAQSRDTLAIYMGLGQCAVVSSELQRHGRKADTPVALIENASRPQQRVVVGRLDELPGLATRHALESPTLLIVGSVADLARSLHWFGTPPLTAAADGEELNRAEPVADEPIRVERVA